MCWISVKDQLPKEETSVLVLQKGNDVCEYLVIQAQMYQGDWYADHENGLIEFHDALDVEYWTKNLPQKEK